MSYGYGPPPPQNQGPYGYGPPQHVVVHQSTVMIAPKSSGTAIVLELLPGFFLQWFGWGNIYAGDVGGGLALMFGYWVLAAINFALCFVLVGFFTWPLTWIAFAILSPILASKACERANRRALGYR
jgi:hypothetical protein